MGTTQLFVGMTYKGDKVFAEAVNLAEATQKIQDAGFAVKSVKFVVAKDDIIK